MLAGERSEQIKRFMAGGQTTGYPIVVPTYVLDEFITRLVREQRISTVLNLAAGLDTRPYRLQLPASLRWIEVDLPELLAYKQGKLADVTPTCMLERIALDLTNKQKRQKLFARINAEAQPTLIVTEGLFLNSKYARLPPTCPAMDICDGGVLIWYDIDD